MQRLVTSRPPGAEHDRFPSTIEQGPLVELGVAVANRVEIEGQRQLLPLAGRRQFAHKVAVGLEVCRLGIVKHQPIDPLVVENEVLRPRLFEILRPAVRVELVAQRFLPLVNRISYMA